MLSATKASLCTPRPVQHGGQEHPVLCVQYTRVDEPSRDEALQNPEESEEIKATVTAGHAYVGLG